MPRPPREIVPGGVYHIATRGNNRQSTFLDEQDRKIYLRILADVRGELQFKLYLYVLMTNHIHLLLKTSTYEEASPPHLMKSLTSRYTKYFNKKYKRTGNLFQPKYFSELVKETNHFLELTRYIHLNPIRAKIVEDMTKYPYSSYLSYINARDNELVDFEDVLSLFGKQKLVQKRRYKQFVEDGLSLWRLRTDNTFQQFL